MNVNIRGTLVVLLMLTSMPAWAKGDSGGLGFLGLVAVIVIFLIVWGQK